MNAIARRFDLTGRVALVAGSNRGHQTARKIAGGSTMPINAFDG
jgi:hypothetical protein